MAQKKWWENRRDEADNKDYFVAFRLTSHIMRENRDPLDSRAELRSVSGLREVAPLLPGGYHEFL